MPSMTIDIAELAEITGENAQLKTRVDDLLGSNTDYLEKRRDAEAKLAACRVALVELAEAASLVVAEYASWIATDLIPAGFVLGEDVERLRARLAEHMPAIEAAQE